jgi:hypothetical protein
VKSVFYGRRNQLFLRGENTKFGLEIELNDASGKFRGERSSEMEAGSEQRRTH